MTRPRILLALAIAAAGMALSAGVATWSLWPHARPAAMALWGFGVCVAVAIVAGLGLYWWEDEVNELLVDPAEASG